MKTRPDRAAAKRKVGVTVKSLANAPAETARRRALLAAAGKNQPRTRGPPAVTQAAAVPLSRTLTCAPADPTVNTYAKTALRPTVQAGFTANALLGPAFAEQPLDDLVNALAGQVKLAAAGDLSRNEAMLVTQAQTLDLLFNKLTRQAALNMGSNYLDATETYFKLAFRAQSQCRAVAETLHEMKHPRPVAFFRQANIANGPQQVNNGLAVEGTPADASRAGEIQKPQNELLEQTHGERLDGRTAQPATASDPCMATVDAGKRAEVEGR